MAREHLEQALQDLDTTASRVDDPTPLPHEPDPPNYPWRFGFLRAELAEAARVLRTHLSEDDGDG